MASVSGTTNKHSAADASQEAKDKVAASPAVIESTDEIVKESFTEADVLKAREEDVSLNFDPVALDNALSATIKGSAGYSANPPSEIKTEELDEPDIKNVNAHAVERQLRAERAVREEETRKAREDKKAVTGKLVDVRLLKDYRPATRSNFAINGSDQVGPTGAGGKVVRGTNVSLPEEEALRAIKLGIAEATPKN